MSHTKLVLAWGAALVDYNQRAERQRLDPKAKWTDEDSASARRCAALQMLITGPQMQRSPWTQPKVGDYLLGGMQRVLQVDKISKDLNTIHAHTIAEIGTSYWNKPAFVKGTVLTREPIPDGYKGWKFLYRIKGSKAKKGNFVVCHPMQALAWTNLPDAPENDFGCKAVHKEICS